MEKEIEKRKAETARNLEDIEKEIRHEVESSFPNMSSEAIEAIIQSRLKILYNSKNPTLQKVDLNPQEIISAYEKLKKTLLEGGNTVPVIKELESILYRKEQLKDCGIALDPIV